MTLSDETLMAFADGTLPEEEADRIADRVAADAALAERVALLAAGGRAARGAFADVLDEPVPERLLAALRRGPPPALRVVPAAPPQPRGAAGPGRTAASVRPVPRAMPRAMPRRGLAIAASVLLGLVGGWALRGGDAGGPGRLGAELAAALERQPSGAEDGQTRILASHALPDGGACRSFTTPGEAGALVGLACRAAEGPWRVAALVARGGAEAGFLPASAEDPLLAEVLERRGAGPALDPAAERAAIARAWRPGG